MRTRLEARKARRTASPKPGRFPRAVFDHVRALLITDNGRRVTLASVRMPLTDDGRADELVEQATTRLREHVTDDTLCESLLKNLELQARAFIESPTRQMARRQREAAPFAKIREVGARKRAKEAEGQSRPKGECAEVVEDQEE